MTKEEILAMKAGRDLDIKIALEVMGFMWLTHLIHFSEEMTVKWLGTENDLAASKGAFIAVKPEKVYALKLRDKFDEAVPNFSTNSSAAQQVVKKMAAAGYQIAENGNPEEICKMALIWSVK